VRMPLETRYSDYDIRGHVNNATFLTYFEMARRHVWGGLAGVTADFNFIIAEAHVRYVSQAKLGDPLAIDVRTTEIRTKAWVWAYRVVDTRDERLVAEGSTVQVMYDYTAQRSVPIPDALRPMLREA
jgi:acyl-CoA thioester hydrolase